MKIELDKNYINNFNNAIALSKKESIKQVKIVNSNNFFFKEIREDINSFLDYENSFEIWLVDFPYCAVNEAARDHVLFKNKGGKNARCQECKYNKLCNGFPIGYFKKFGQSELIPIKDVPVEVMIEVESKCNFQCKFCYNHSSFAKEGRDKNNLSSDRIKKIINHVKDVGVKTVRFTGGEPLVRKDVFELMEYAKGKDLEVRLNTNGSLVNKGNISRMKGVVDNVLISIESWDELEENKITGYENSLKLKINAIKLFDEMSTPMIRVGTVVTEDNIKNFQKLSDLVLGLPIHEWEFYRPISSSKKLKVKSEKLIEDLIDNIVSVQGRTDIKISIANAIPFCSVSEPSKLNNISSGALFDDGYSRIVVDPRGWLKPHYFFEKNIGDSLNILEAWNCDFMKQMRNLQFLPEECENCRFQYKCRGGSRHEAMIFNQDINALDPLANTKNII